MGTKGFKKVSHKKYAQTLIRLKNDKIMPNEEFVIILCIKIGCN